MGHLDHAAFGWLTPVLSYAMACVGAALGLRCTVRALDATGRSRRNWLLTAASAIGSGIWTMHFVAMLGFGVRGTDIRYDVPLTVLGLVVAMGVVGVGVFVVGHGGDRVRSLLIGGLTTGVGVASMHYLGMAALRLHGQVRYDPLLVGLSVLIAVVAATAALWAALHIHAPAAVAVASLVMGAAVSSMHYTGMLAVSVEVAPSGAALPGATVMQFVFPLAVGLGSYLFVTAAFVALSPTAGERAAYASAGRPAAPDGHPEDAVAPPGPRAAGVVRPRTH
ncbi:MULTISPECIES: MHYT domain-containing protein [unclassified Streptomyces]|uniref:MHYT domain-containing protein n=1 Tax=unclassified Streptomyces TaxID=2593676 RepID=UPI0035D8B3DA